MRARRMSHKLRILVVAGDPRTQKILKSILAANGYEVRFSIETSTAIEELAAFRPEMMILDLDLVESDAIPDLRSRSDAPMIALSSQHREAELVSALDGGADDYIEKPPRPSELLARIRSLLRRSLKARGEEPAYRCGPLLINILAHTVMRSGDPVKLSPTEFEILSLLARNSGRVVPYERFLEPHGSVRHCDNMQALRAAIWSLRQKVEADPHQPGIVLTEERIGYRIVGYPADEIRSP